MTHKKDMSFSEAFGWAGTILLVCAVLFHGVKYEMQKYTATQIVINGCDEAPTAKETK